MLAKDFMASKIDFQLYRIRQAITIMHEFKYLCFPDWPSGSQLKDELQRTKITRGTAAKELNVSATPKTKTRWRLERREYSL